MERIGYFNGCIGDLDTMQIPLCDRSVFYGDAVYDAVLVLDRKCFALEEHLQRLYNSCAMTQIPFTMTKEELEGEIARLLELSPLGEAMLYIQVTRGAAPRKHEFPIGATPNLIMYTAPIHLPPRDKRASLAKVEDLRFQYCNIKTTNLMPNVFAAQKATSLGATEALMHLGQRVTEAAHSSILMVKDGALVVPPLDQRILPGITRAILERLCQENNIPVITRIFTVEELLDADEILLCSTTKNVLRVFSVDGQEVAGKDPALAEKLQDLFLAEVSRQTGVTCR